MIIRVIMKRRSPARVTALIFRIIMIIIAGS